MDPGREKAWRKKICYNIANDDAVWVDIAILLEESIECL